MKDLWDALHVRRWACNPAMSHVTDTTAAHSGRMIALAIDLGWGASDGLAEAIMFHDAHESILGDPPFGMKAADPDLADAYDAASYRVNYSNDWVCPEKHVDSVKFLDRLDAYLFVKLNAPNELTKPDWIKAREWLLTMSRGFSRDVGTML